jgi:hypothetical protein
LRSVSARTSHRRGGWGILEATNLEHWEAKTAEPLPDLQEDVTFQLWSRLLWRQAGRGDRRSIFAVVEKLSTKMSAAAAEHAGEVILDLSTWWP